MLEVTPAAAAHLAGMLDKIEAPKEVALRLAPNDDGNMSMKASEAKEDDRAFKHEERIVLVVDRQTAKQLADAKIDVTNSPKGPQVTIAMASA